ncbi:ABC transporter permease/substrate-binding protein [Isobaculum melis]|uniref:Osmoprotectant transport system permease protein n=1 Tax=Isobaculum melis TaxID=142588 RepID=A0A1H9QRY6_9LACT|nr:ABC transporter permease/substrate-binding protein [Isobaculum melis]SER62995.1 osmoprotectant transport system permease protein [Isobaculum melis]
MNDFIQLLSERKNELWTAILEHIQLSLLALLIAIFIALPLGIYLAEHKKIAEPMIQVTAIFQTIPSLALLGLLIPIVGIGTLPAVIALVVYALLPILRNTYTGIIEVDDSLIEASEAMGMNRLRRLMKVQIPIAMPMMMAGIRTSMVLIIGTATLAALIGAGGLGSLILLGIDRNNHQLILLGAIPAALLAILFDFLLGRLKSVSIKKMLWILGGTLIVFLGFALAPLFNKQQNEIVIAGKLGSEPELLIHMYQYLIEDQTDLKVTLKPNMGKTSFLFNALQSGNIDIYPEFTGTVLETFLDEHAASNDAGAVYQQAKDGLAKEFEMAYLKPMTYNNTYALAVTPQIVEKYQVKTISDLQPLAGTIKAGFTLEFTDRKDGYLGIQDQYGFRFAQLQTMEPKLRYTATQSGDIDVIDAYSTDSELAEYRLTVLKDDLGLFPPYQGAPLMLASTLKKYPELEPVLGQLAGKITDAEMRQMNFEVNVNGKTPQAVAKDFLIKEKLLAP